ncbi:MAG: hypothetical protein JWO85_3463 [Candidatus Eremiobacteraeota bacterium]|nr:hypothetical protein [Candidatus Eremiobacteraeota bacterium]
MASVPPRIGPTLGAPIAAQPRLASQKFSYSGIVFDWTQFETPEMFELSWRTLGGVEDIPTSSGQPAQRVAQTLGVVLNTIKFEASFIGPNALTKALAMEALQQAQNSGPFQFGARTIQCTIFAFTEKYRTINDITYDVELEPTIETSKGAPAGGSTATAALKQNLALIANYPTPPALAQLDAVVPAITAAKNTKFPGAALADLQKLSTTFQSAKSQLNTLMAAKSGSTLAADTTTFLAAAGLVGQLSTAVSTISSFTGATGTKVAVGGLNAYQIATRYTGDINNVETIMSANGIQDPFNIGAKDIVIPAILKAI